MSLDNPSTITEWVEKHIRFSVELLQRTTEAAFLPLRRFAEEQIKGHENEVAEAWMEAVEEFQKEIESVTRKSVDRNGATGISAAAEAADSPAPDTDH